MTIPSDPLGVRMKDKTEAVKEPSIIIKPIGKLGGLDGLHVTFVIVIALLLALLLVVSYLKPVIINPGNSTATTTVQPVSGCASGYELNGTCASTPIHTAAQVENQTEKVLASYATVNGSLSILPYFSNVSSASAVYLPQSGEWYVSLKARNPESGAPFLVSFLVSDADLSKVTPSMQMAIPSAISKNRVVSLGTVQLAGKYACNPQSPMSVYWFMDPYATGSIASLANATSLESRLGSKANLTVKIFNGPSTQAMSAAFGAGNALTLGRYVFCASQQPNFKNFAADLESLYTGSYVQPSTLAGIANVSGLDHATLDTCLETAPQIINNQAVLASYYNITQTPSVVVDCEYGSLPQTAAESVCYANSTLC
jgi:hypothetical protein